MVDQIDNHHTVPVPTNDRRLGPANEIKRIFPVDLHRNDWVNLMWPTIYKEHIGKKEKGGFGRWDVVLYCRSSSPDKRMK